MGVVHQALDEVLGRQVAVKVLRTYSDATEAELAELCVRMRREARAAARIQHPGVITTHDVAEHEGRPVVVMEFVDGPSLEDVLADRGPLDPKEAARIGAAVADALAAAHRVGILHRDVKPGNVLLEDGGRVVLTDFGIASTTAPGDGAPTRLTRTGELVGSLDFLPPERAEDIGEPGPEGDVWSLGMTLYAAVEGKPAFHCSSVVRTLTAIATEPLPEPRRAGPLAAVLAALLAKDPLCRPSAEVARKLLEAVVTELPAASAGTAGVLAGTPGGVPFARPAVPIPPPQAGASAADDGSASPPAAAAQQEAAGGRPYVPASLADRTPQATTSSGGRHRHVAVVAAVATVLAGSAITYLVMTGSGTAPQPGRRMPAVQPMTDRPTAADSPAPSPRPSTSPHPHHSVRRPVGTPTAAYHPRPTAPTIPVGPPVIGGQGAVAGTDDGGSGAGGTGTDSSSGGGIAGSVAGPTGQIAGSVAGPNS